MRSRTLISDIEAIEAAYFSRDDSSRLKRLIAREEIAENEFDLSVSRYVDAREEEREIDLNSLRMQRAETLAERSSLESKLAMLLREIGVG